MKPPETGSGDHSFGDSVAIDNHLLVIGSPNDDTYGSASVYHWNANNQTWVQEAKLSISNRLPGDKFGASVGCSGNRVVVGAPNHGGTGAVYVYHRDDTTSRWDFIKELSEPNSGGLYHFDFGSSVAISGDFIIVGSPDSTDLSGNAVGSAFIYICDSEGIWGSGQKLDYPDADQGAQFGLSVDVDGIVAVVSSQSDLGSVYVYRFSMNITSGFYSWSKEAKLLPIGGEQDGDFGTSVAVSGNIIVAGSPGAGNSFGNSGAAFVYRWSPSKGWLHETKLVPEDVESFDNFGLTVDISDNTIVIGSIGKKNQTGFASVFAYQEGLSKWTKELKLEAGKGITSEVSISGVTVIVGLPYHDRMNPVESGSGVIFQMNEVCTLNFLNCFCDNGSILYSSVFLVFASMWFLTSSSHLLPRSEMIAVLQIRTLNLGRIFEPIRMILQS